MGPLLCLYTGHIVTLSFYSHLLFGDVTREVNIGMGLVGVRATLVVERIVTGNMDVLPAELSVDTGKGVAAAFMPTSTGARVTASRMPSRTTYRLLSRSSVLRAAFSDAAVRLRAEAPIREPETGEMAMFGSYPTVYVGGVLVEVIANVIVTAAVIIHALAEGAGEVATRAEVTYRELSVTRLAST